MAQIQPAVVSTNGLLYALFNGSALADQGQSTLFIPPANASPVVVSYCNLITITITNVGLKQLALLGSATPPVSPLIGSATASWLTLSFPGSIYSATALAGLTIASATLDGTALPSGTWTTLATTAPDPVNGNQAMPVLVVFPTKQVEIDEGEVLTLTLTGVAPQTASPMTAPQPGAFFWNEATDLNSLYESQLFPQFWMVVAAPDPTQLTASMPLVATWYPADFALSAYGADFTSNDINRAADAAYATPPQCAEVFNNLALRLNFSTQAGPVAAAPTTSLNIGFIAADQLPAAGIPFLSPTAGLLDSTNVGADAALVVASSGEGWQIAAPALQETFLYAWAITFSGTNIVSSLATAEVGLQLEQFLSATAAQTGGSPPYATACVIWWTGAPGAVDGCITLRLMVLPPVPAMTSLSFSPPTNAPVKGMVTVTWTTYAAASASLVQTSASNLTVITPLPTGENSYPVVANPFSGTDLNAGTMSFALSLSPYGGGSALPSNASVLTLQPLASPSLAIAGALAIDASDSTVETTFTLIVPETFGACVATAFGTGLSVSVAGGATGTLTVPVVGGALDLQILAPGGPYAITNVEASTWVPSAPPPASTVLVFPYLPAAATPSLAPDLYVWQPGYPLRSLATVVGSASYSPYSTNWNNAFLPALTLWPPTSGTTGISWPYGSGGSVQAMLEITWTSGVPALALAPDNTFFSAGIYPGTNTGPLITAGGVIPNDNNVLQVLCLNNASPFKAIWTFTGATNWNGVYHTVAMTNPSIPCASYVRAISCPFPSNPAGLYVIYGVYPGGASLLASGYSYTAMQLNGAVPSDIDVDQPNQRGIFSAATNGVWQLCTLETSGSGTVAGLLPALVPCAPQNSRQQSLVPVSVGRQSSTIFYVAGTLDGSMAHPGRTVGIACYASADGATALPLFTLPATDEPFIPTLIAAELQSSS